MFNVFDCAFRITCLISYHGFIHVSVVFAILKSRYWFQSLNSLEDHSFVLIIRHSIRQFYIMSYFYTFLEHETNKIITQLHWQLLAIKTLLNGHILIKRVSRQMIYVDERINTLEEPIDFEMIHKLNIIFN